MIRVKDILDEVNLKREELIELEEEYQMTFISWLHRVIRCDEKSVIEISISLNKIILHSEGDKFMVAQNTTTELYNKFISLLKDPRFINHSIKVKENNIEKELLKITYRQGFYAGFRFYSSNVNNNSDQRFQNLYIDPPEINPIQININFSST